MDPVTYRMLDALETYGRFGKTKPDVALFIIRTWLWENEARLRAGITSKDVPLGSIHLVTEA